MAGVVHKPVRQNSFDAKKDGAPARTSLRDRMKLFEKNIQKNEELGTTKKKALW